MTNTLQHQRKTITKTSLILGFPTILQHEERIHVINKDTRMGVWQQVQTDREQSMLNTQETTTRTYKVLTRNK